VVPGRGCYTDIIEFRPNGFGTVPRITRALFAHDLQNLNTMGGFLPQGGLRPPFFCLST
jgi:hypothetical protein